MEISIPPSSANRTTRKKKIYKDAEDLNNKTNQLDLIDINRTPQPTAAEYTIFFSKDPQKIQRDNIMGYKTKLHKSLKLEIIYSVFFDYNRIN